MSTTVWVVSEHRGEYESYSVRIVAAFSSEQKANAFADQNKSKDDAKRMSAREEARPYYGPVHWEIDELPVDQFEGPEQNETPHTAT